MSGLNRGALRRQRAVADASAEQMLRRRPEPPAVTHPVPEAPAAGRASNATAQPVAFRRLLSWGATGAGLAAVAAGFAWAADQSAVRQRLAEESASRASMICVAGHINRGDGSLLAWFTASAAFVCTEWKLGQPPDMSSSPRRLR